MECCICGNKNLSKQQGHTVDLEESERSLITKSLGGEAPKEYFYCKGCWKACTSKQMAPQIVKGIVSASLVGDGVEVKKAEKVSNKFFDLLAKSPKISR